MWKKLSGGITGVMCFWIILFLVQNKLQQWFTPFQYVDELFGLLIVPLAVWRLVQGKLHIVWTEKTVLFAILLAVFWVSGWCGYFCWHYQPFLNTAKDSYVNLKFFLAAGASWLMFIDDTADLEQVRRWLWPLVNVAAVILFVLCVADLCFGIFEGNMRGGLRAVKLFYSAYTFLAGICVFLCAICLWLYEEHRKKIMIPLILLTFVMLSTRRVKAMGAAACLLLIYIFIFRKRQRISRKVKILATVVLAVAGVSGIYQLVSYYILMGMESARAVLTVAAPFIAWDHFPFGTGWGTYGSAFSVEPYSPVYSMYRMEGVWGLSSDYPDFVADTFWPMILAQCGFFGFLAFIGVLILLGRRIWRLKKDKSAFASARLLAGYLLISSTSESAFANPAAVPLAFWLGFLFAQHRIRIRRMKPRKVGK